MNDASAFQGAAPQKRRPAAWQTLAAVAVLGCLVAAAVLAVAQIYPSQLPATKNPSFVDNIFDSRVVILLIRVAIIFAAGYVVVSVVGLIVGRRWLAELGPFKASEPVAQLERGTEVLKTDLDDGVEGVEYLKRRLAESDQALTQARSAIQFLVGRIDTMESDS